MRLYRASFVPAVLALVVAAFSLQARPAPVIGTPLAPDAFDGRRAMRELRLLEDAYPDRRPGAPDDDRLADRVAQALRRGGEFSVSVRRFRAHTSEGRRTLRTVVGVRPGLTGRRLVVVAHRDALARGSTAQLSGTEALLELARVFRVGRSLQHTLVLVSTSGGSAGAAGAREFAEDPGGPVDGVLVLDDVAGERTRRPLVVPWSNALGAAPPRLVDTVGVALRAEAGLRPGGYRLPAKVARLAFPLTTGEQGEFNERGLPAVLLSLSGERGPGAARAVSRKRLESVGRAALRSITALDGAPRLGDEAERDLPIQTKLLPYWAVRLVVLALILPAVVAIVDGFARVRRRRHPVGMWVRWALTAALPFLLVAGMAALLRVTGLVAAPGAPPPPGAIPVDGVAAAVLASAAVLFVLGWLGVRPAVLRLLGVRGRSDSPGAAAAVSIVLVALAVAVWVANAYAAALLLPAVHLWLLAADARLRIPRPIAVAMVLAALLPMAAVAAYYAAAFDLGPADLAWTAFLLVAGGHLGPAGVLAWSVLLGCLLSVLAVVRHRRPVEPPAESRTRPLFAYGPPGALSDKESVVRR